MQRKEFGRFGVENQTEGSLVYIKCMQKYSLNNIKKYIIYNIVCLQILRITLNLAQLKLSHDHKISDSGQYCCRLRAVYGWQSGW